jgi:glycosyltransferase involved in cell wall biosynthesis
VAAVTAEDRVLASGSQEGVVHPRISVITPAYNVGKYIGEAVDSVLRQTYRDFEYLVVDDGSTDDTVAEVSRRIPGDPRLRLIIANHGGSGSARNAGLAEARGEFIAFLDGDDRWHPDFLGRQLAVLESLGSEVAAVFARSRVISESGRLYALRWQRSGRYDFDQMLIQSCPPRTGSSLLIRKRSFDQAGGFTERVADLDMWLRIQRDTDMPYFWGSASYLLDLRVRAGAISRNHEQRFENLDALIASFAPGLQHSHRGLAYIRAAVFAFRAGHDEYAVRWAEAAREAGLWPLLADSYGRRLIGWALLPATGRRALRRGDALARAVIGRVLRAPGGLLR